MDNCLVTGCDKRDNKGAFGYCGLHYKRFRRNGNPLVVKRDNSKINHDVFETIDTEDKAYWLGFLLADGCIRISKSGQHTIKLALAIKDIEHLEKFKLFVNSKNKIYKYKVGNGKNLVKSEVCEFVVTSKKMVEDLTKFGIGPNKSLTVKLPYLDNEELERHMIRGIWDGDGSVIRKINYSYSLVDVQICGNKNIVESINNILWERLGIEKSKITPTSSIFLFRKTNKKAAVVCNYLYKNCSIYLNRKYENASLVFE